MSASFAAAIAEDQRRERAASSAFVRAVQTGSAASLHNAISEIESAWAWKRAFRACSRLGAVPFQIQLAFLDLWIAAGETIRSNVGDDAVTLAASPGSAAALQRSARASLQG